MKIQNSKIAILTFTKNGAQLGEKISVDMKKSYSADVCAATTNDRAAYILPKVDKKPSEWVREKFSSCDLLIFIGACGIAVRLIAPFLESKTKDPAVLVIDDGGHNVISLLSGHIGGANDWTLRLAGFLYANPVITTASDCNNKTAIDMFAKKNELVIANYNKAKNIESALLDGELITLKSDIEIIGDIPNEFDNSSNENDYSIYIGIRNNSVRHYLWLIPKCVIVGVGCRLKKSKESIIDSINKAFDKVGIDSRSTLKICSIEMKKNEPGILEAAKSFGVEAEFFSVEELEKVNIDSEPSQFVKQITGVDNVCERAARVGSNGGRVILKKQRYEGVTVSLAYIERSVTFE